MNQLPIGAVAPDFELNSADGQVYRLTDALKSGPVALAFYKAACPTSQFTFPHLQRICADERRAPRVPIWGISQDDSDETRTFAEQLGIRFPLLVDEHPYAVSSAYGLEFLPAIVIVAVDRKINLSDFGFTKSSLNRIAGFEMFTGDDGVPASMPG